MAVALIETPMRIQPTQNYAIRIQIIGRDRLEDEVQTGGLSTLSHGHCSYRGPSGSLSELRLYGPASRCSNTS